MTQPTRTVLVFAYECAPFHDPSGTVGAQRVAHFAKYLPEFGWRAIVLCCDARRRGTGWSAEAEERVRRELRAADVRESLIIATPSLAADGLLDRTWRRLLPRVGRADRVRDALRKPLTVAKLLTGDYSQNWQPCARRSAELVARGQRIDACLGEYNPDAGLFLARWFAGYYGVPWVADFRDPLLQAVPRAVRRAYLPVARRQLATAAATIAVNEYLAELDRRLLRRPSVTIPNGYDPDDFRAPLTGPEPAYFTVAYTGTIHPAMRPALFLHGLAALRDAVGDDAFRHVRFAYRGVRAEALSSMAAGLGLSSVVDARPQIPRDEAIALLRRAHVLLLLTIVPSATGDEYLARGLQPGKMFEYLGAGRPILAVPGDGGLGDDLIARTGAGVVLRTPERIGAYLADAFRAWKEGRPLACTPRADELARYSRRALAERLADTLDRAAGQSAAASSRRGRRVEASLSGVADEVA